MVLKSLLSLLALSATTAVASANNTPLDTLKFDFNEIAFGTRKLSKELQFNREKAAHGLFESLCKGFGNKTSRILTLTTDRAVQRRNRELSGCASDPCKGKAFNSACVQFPWASTIESAEEPHFTCVPPLSQFFQGAILSSFRIHEQIRSGQKFKVEICNFDCASLTPLPSHERRFLSPEVLQKGRLETFPPFTSNNEGFSTGIIPLPQILDAGSYSVKTVDQLGTPASRQRLVGRAPTPVTGSLPTSNPGNIGDQDGNLYPPYVDPPLLDKKPANPSFRNARADANSRDPMSRRHNNPSSNEASFTIDFTLDEKTCGIGLALFLNANATIVDVTTTFTRLSS